MSLPHRLAHLPRQPRQQGGAGVRLGLGGGCYQIFLLLDTGYFCHLVSPGVDDDGAEGVYGDRGGDGAAGGQMVQVVTQRDRLQLRERVRTFRRG